MCTSLLKVRGKESILGFSSVNNVAWGGAELGSLSRGNVAYSSPSKGPHSVEWAAAASGSWGGVCCGCEKAVGSWNTLFQDPTVSVLWRCPTLPHPPRCSTIGACGLSFQVRNGGWAFPRGYDHHKMVQPYSLQCPQRVPRACWPRVGRGGLCWL